MIVREMKNLSIQGVEARFVPSTLNEEKRTIEVVFSKGARVKRFSWIDGVFEEELSLKRGNVRLERLNAGAAVLNNHSAYSLGDVIGVVEKASVRKGEDGESEAVATLRFSTRADVEPIYNDVKAGILRNISVGYRVHKYERTKEGEGENAKLVMRAVDWEPMEVSFVAIPADAGAQVRSEVREYPCEIIFNRGEDEMTVTTTTQAPDTRQADIDAAKAQAAKEAVEAERIRVAEVTAAVRAAKLDDAFKDKLLASGVSADEARKQIIAELGRAEKAAPTTSTNTVEAGKDARDHLRAGAVTALLNRYDPKKYPLDDNGRRLRGLSVGDLAKECLEAAGVKTRGMDVNTLWEASMNLKRGSMHTTSDFPEILANTANKTLRDAYAEAPQTFLPFTREVEVPDFKQISRAQLGDAPNLLKVLEHGEVTRGTIGEGAEKYNVETYERIVAVTRKVIINDDLEAFTRVPALMGRAARDLESDLIWGIITANAVMGDGIALFQTATHKNLASVAAAISVASIGLGRTAMRNQTGLNGRLLNIMPSWLVVPAELETVAEQFTGPINPETATNANPFSGKLKVVAEPRLASLSGGSATAWYLFAGQGSIDMIEMAKLRGLREPSITTREGWDVEGMEIKVLMDVGVKAIDYRGLYKNAGV